MAFNQINPDGSTTYGITTLDSDAILQKLNSNVRANVIELTGKDIPIDTSEQSVIGRLNEIFANRISAVWEQSKLIEESMYVETSSGVSLSKLALLVGFLRNPSTTSVGELRLFGDNGVLIPAGSLFASSRGDQFTNTTTFSINISSCLSTNMKVGVAVSGREYRVDINNTQYTFESVDASHYNILTSLAAVINTSDIATVTPPTIDDGADSFMTINKNNKEFAMTVQASSSLTPYFVEVEQPITAIEKGLVFGDAGTITEVVTPITGLEQVVNPTDLRTGGEQETDVELRERIATDYNSVGSGTLSTIGVALEQIPTVVSAYVDENRLLVPSVPDNIPAKSYETIVHHVGDGLDIAQAIWDFKPAGIETHGDTIYPVVTSKGDAETVRFTKAAERFAYVRVKYDRLLNEDEEFPEDGDSLIENSVAEEGLTYLINQDVIGKRFYAPIFENVEGVETLEIEVFLSEFDNLDIELITELQWETRLSVSRVEIALFAPSRVLPLDNNPPP